MKTTYLVIVFFSVFNMLYSQIAETTAKEVRRRNMLVYVSGGYSAPLGIYASSDKTNKNSGYAGGGFTVEAGVAWMGKKHLGLAVQYDFLQNPAKNMANLVYPNGVPDSVGSGPFTSHCLLLGPVFMMNIKRLYLEAKLLGGVMLSTGKIFNTPDPTDTTGTRSSQNTGTGFGFQLSAGVGYTIVRNLTFKFNLGLLGGWPVARNQYPSVLVGYQHMVDPVTHIGYDTPVYSAPVDLEVKKPVMTLNPSFGLVYQF